MMRYHHDVRTTVDLDPNVLVALKKMAARDGITLGKVIESLLFRVESDPTIEMVDGAPVIRRGRRKGSASFEQIQRMREELE